MNIIELFESMAGPGKAVAGYTAATKDGASVEVYSVRGEPDETRFPDFEGRVMYVVAKVDGKLAGSADFYFDPQARFGSVEEVSVQPEWRRKGIASMMYDYLEHRGFRVEPSSGRIEPDGVAFWRNRSGAKRFA